MFDAAELPYKKEKPKIYLNKEEKLYAENFLKKNHLSSSNVIGLHLGVSPRWPSKAWHQSRIEEFIFMAKKEGYEILFFSGPDEDEEKILKLLKNLNQKKITLIRNNPHNTIRQFSSLVNLCKAIICSDSFALHISLSLNKPTVGLFFCTSPDEVEGYDLLKKIASPRLYEFFPERMNEYDEELVKSISPEEILAAIKDINQHSPILKWKKKK